MRTFGGLTTARPVLYSGHFSEIKLFCFVVAMSDLVHDVEAIRMAYVNC